MKKYGLMVLIISFMNYSHPFSEEWLNYLEQLNTWQCLRKRNLVKTSKEDVRLAVKKIDEALEKIEVNYKPIIGKTILHDYLLHLAGVELVYFGILGWIVSYRKLSFKRTWARNRLAENTNTITQLYEANNHAQIPAALNYSHWLRNNWLPLMEKDYKFELKISLICLISGFGLGSWWFNCSRKNMHCMKDIGAYLDLKILRFILWAGF